MMSYFDYVEFGPSRVSRISGRAVYLLPDLLQEKQLERNSKP